MRKNPRIEKLESAYGRPIAEIVADAYTRHGTIYRAAESLGVNPRTFHGWMVRFRVTVKKVAQAPKAKK